MELSDFLPIIILFGSLVILLFLSVPIAFAIGGAALITILAGYPFDIGVKLFAQQMERGLNSFGMLALPFFILAGNFMNRGGLAKRLINLALLLAGRLPGSLSYVNVLANMMFGSLSGSATASAAAIGGILTPMNKAQKYPADFTTAVNVASCPTGLLIPPSNVLIIYALAAGTVSVKYLFVAGYLPGILMGFGIIVAIALLGKKNNLPKVQSKLQLPIIKTIWDSFPTLLMVVIIMGGIVAGIFTATEAAAIAVAYSFVLGVAYGELKLKHMYPILLDSVVTTTIVLIMVGSSTAMSYVMTDNDIPGMISDCIIGFSSNPIIIMLLINIILLIVGTFMDLTPAVLIFTPIFLPIVQNIGVDPVHFGIIMIFNLCIGICTPPVGTALFVGCSVSETKISEVVPKLLPIFGAMVITLLLTMYIPSITLCLPHLMGYTGH